MATPDRDWIELRIGITSEEAIAFLEALAEDGELRERLEKSPRDVLLEWNIDLLPESAPDRVVLPPRETIARHAESLRLDDPFGTVSNLPHGYIVLYVVHGNGIAAPPPPRGD